VVQNHHATHTTKWLKQLNSVKPHHKEDRIRHKYGNNSLSGEELLGFIFNSVLPENGPVWLKHVATFVIYICMHFSELNVKVSSRTKRDSKGLL
jgi:hypothetical protein